MVFCKTPTTLCVFCLLLFAGCEPGAQPRTFQGLTNDWGMAVNGLRISIKPVVNSDPAATGCIFDMYFQNVGKNDTVLNLGTTLGKGRVHYPHAVRLAIFDENGSARRLEFSFTADGTGGGRMDAFAVPLPVGSTYTVRLNLSDYYCPDSGEYFLELPEGEYRAYAQFEGKNAVLEAPDANEGASVNFWNGRVQSNVSKFRLSRRTID